MAVLLVRSQGRNSSRARCRCWWLTVCALSRAAAQREQ